MIPCFIFIQGKEKGQALYDLLFEYLNLEESDYFGLNYYDKSDNLVRTVHIIYIHYYCI